ncbi:MAG: M48 family metallopeptidase [Clostridia bacterium]|nr:M48 family metallopeptidase [Clostridia bacterium]
MNYPIEIIRSDRTTVALEITKELTVRIRAPKGVPDAELYAIAEKHAQWIEKHMEVMRRKNSARTAYELTEEDAERLKSLARKVIPPKVEHYAKLMGVKPKSVRITSAHSRFGSCSAQNGLCFSYILMRYPEEAIDYVVVHELAHIKHHNHSRSFYAFIGKFMPDYKRRETMLREDQY